MSTTQNTHRCAAPAAVSEFHVVETVQLTPAQMTQALKTLETMTVEDREKVRQTFMRNIETDAAVLGEALARAKSHLKLPLAFASFPYAVDWDELKAQLQKISDLIADASLEMTRLADIILPE